MLWQIYILENILSFHVFQLSNQLFWTTNFFFIFIPYRQFQTLHYETRSKLTDNLNWGKKNFRASSPETFTWSQISAMKIVIIITWTPLPWSRSSLTFPFRIWGKSQFEWYRMWREWTCENFCENLHKVSCLRYSQFGSKLLELTSFDVGFYNHKKRNIKSLPYSSTARASKYLLLALWVW